MSSDLNAAHSFSTGIRFYSSHNDKYVTMATIDESQNIKTRWLLEDEADK